LDIGNKQGESDEVKDASVRMIDDTHFEGFVTTYPKYIKTYDPKGQITMYFWGETSQKPIKTGSFNAEGISQNSTSAKGKGAGLFLEYKTTEGAVVEMKVGLSYTSTENAKRNFEAEATSLSFDQAKARAQKVWEQELGKIYVEGTDKNNKVKFYTGLFHGLLGRGTASDVSGTFPQYGGTIGQLPLMKKGNPSIISTTRMPFGAPFGTLPSCGHFLIRIDIKILYKLI
jgi:putative alpha-1,2-mannosidase